MYGSSLYGSGQYCPFTYERGFYGEPEAHVTNCGASTLSVPGVEAPSSVPAEHISNAPETTSQIIWADTARETTATMTAEFADIAVPGADAPSTTYGVQLSEPGAVAFAAPCPPTYMYTRTFTYGQATPYLYDSQLYDERVLEDPFSSYKTYQYNTGMAVAGCLFGSGPQETAGGFVYSADLLAAFGAHNTGETSCVLADEMSELTFLMSDSFSATAPFTWEGVISDVLQKAQEMPHIPQIIRGAASVPGVQHGLLDTGASGQMTVQSHVLQVFSSPTGAIIVPDWLTSGDNGMHYLNADTDRIIYGSKYMYLSRNAQYLGITNWHAIFLDAHKSAHVISPFKEADLLCGASGIDFIPVDYLFALHKPVAAFSYPAANMDAATGDTFPQFTYGSELYLGRSAIYAGIMHAFASAPGSVVVLKTPMFANYTDPAIYFGFPLVDLPASQQWYAAPECAQCVYGTGLELADYVCWHSGSVVDTDTIGEWAAFSPVAAPTLDAAVSELEVSEGVLVFDSPFATVTDMGVSLFGLHTYPVFEHYDTSEGVLIATADLDGNSESAIPSFVVDGELVFVERYAQPSTGDLDVVAALTSDLSTTPAMTVTGYELSVLAVYSYIGETRAQYELFAVSALMSVFTCDDAAPELPGYVLDGELYTIDVLPDMAYPYAETRDCYLVFTESADCTHSHAYYEANEDMLLLATAHISGWVAQQQVHEILPIFSEVSCAHSASDTAEAETVFWLITTQDTRYMWKERILTHNAEIVFADADMAGAGTVSGALILELADTPMLVQDVVVTAMIAYGTHNCVYSAAQFVSDRIAEGVYINIAPQPFWYDFVLEYDYQSTTDPTDMAFIF